MAAKVLIVDDEPNIVISLEFLMRQAGYQVAVARTGPEALTALAELTPDLVLLDVMLPGLDGFSLCRQIRANPEWKTMKILFLTAKGRDSDLHTGLKLGADGYVTKPFSTQALLEQVRDFLAAG